ncbi:hypothetical protein CASFOL_029545 [Castilleja foliolosa]|uniref:Di19 zinc-binding domain-containing protein n=1 Tax=Castilleja foliolosa TaxID=1961234 RepID=A0ABD3C9J1_9LAMI
MGDRLLEDLGITLYDYHEDEDETEGEYEFEEEVNASEKEEKFEELACPFCTEDFDVLGLCCHIDADHRTEVKSGICPVCSTKNYSARSRSAILRLRKDLQDKYLRFMKDSYSGDSSSDVVTDSKLMSFVNNPNHAYRPQTSQSASSTKAGISMESPNGDLSERNRTSFVNGLE